MQLVAHELEVRKIPALDQEEWQVGNRDLEGKIFVGVETCQAVERYSDGGVFFVQGNFQSSILVEYDAAVGQCVRAYGGHGTYPCVGVTDGAAGRKVLGCRAGW